MDQTTLFIPIKRYSTRVKDKTNKPFFGERTLFDIKISQALRFVHPKQIIVTTDFTPAADKAKELGVGVQFLPDLSHYAWLESLKNMVIECPTPYFCLFRATTPFLDESFLKRFLEFFLSDLGNFDSAVTVLKIQERIFDKESRPLNFSIGSGHLDSQDTSPIYKEVCGLSIISKELAESYGYHYGKKPKLFLVDQFSGIDINDDEDWQAAQTLAEIPSFAAKLKN